jgi:hypothetical protein
LKTFFIEDTSVIFVNNIVNWKNKPGFKSSLQRINYKFLLLFMTVRTLLVGFLLLGLVSCTTNNATKGAIGGAALGTGMGAIIGSATGKAGPGMAIGAAAGALSGALIGNAMDTQDQERSRVEEQQLRQQQELERQRREIEELKRQERYDDMYRRY